MRTLDDIRKLLDDPNARGALEDYLRQETDRFFADELSRYYSGGREGERREAPPLERTAGESYRTESVVEETGGAVLLDGAGRIVKRLSRTRSTP